MLPPRSGEGYACKGDQRVQLLQHVAKLSELCCRKL